MRIKHLPNSTNPYESNGYCRIPERPIAGDIIFIYCRIEERKNKANTPLLHLIVNNKKQETILEGVYESSAENGYEYYSFQLGTYDAGDCLSYKISCQEEEQVVNSDWYQFEILKELSFSAPDKIYYYDKSILLLYPTEGAEYFLIKLNLEKDIVKIEMDCNGIIPKEMELLNISLQLSEIDYSIHIEPTPFTLSICNSKGDYLIHLEEGSHKLTLLKDNENSVRNICIKADLKTNALYGFGEKFNQVNQIGYQTKNYVYEHFTHQKEKTYLPVPFFFTDEGYGFYYDTNYPINFSTEEKEEKLLLTVDAVTNSKTAINSAYLFFGQPEDIIKQYLSCTGKCALPPKWSFGPWMSANGWNTQRETLEQIDKMKEYDIPATVLVLEAWSDETTFYLFNEAKYSPKPGEDYLKYEDLSFEKDGKWPNPKEMSKILHDNNVKLVLWQIPVIKHMEMNDNLQHSNDECTVIEKGYCVKNKNGEPYLITDNWFKDSLVLDFTNQKAKDWWFSKRRYLIEELQVDGFKTDGGEFIYDNQAVFSNGKSGEEMRNLYPNLYVGGYHEFLNQYKGEGQGVTFSRAGYKGAQSFPIHWAGDQMSEYEEFRSQVKAGLSAGLSGIIFWGFDIAGFAGDLPTTDLFLRSTAMAAFSPVMQFHSEPRYGQFFLEKRRSWINDRTPWNMAEVNGEPLILEVYKKYANIRMNLMPYIYNEAIYCSEQGRPMFAHLIVDYPKDKKVINIEDEYLFGRSMLVAPIIQEGANARTVYLPKGIWHDFFRGEKYEGGREFEYVCPLGEIPVFIKDESAIPLDLADSLQLADPIGNSLNCYHNFAVKMFGEKGNLKFDDDLGNHFKLIWDGMDININGTCLEKVHFINDK